MLLLLMQGSAISDVLGQGKHAVAASSNSSSRTRERSLMHGAHAGTKQPAPGCDAGVNFIVQPAAEPLLETVAGTVMQHCEATASDQPAAMATAQREAGEHTPACSKLPRSDTAVQTPPPLDAASSDSTTAPTCHCDGEDRSADSSEVAAHSSSAENCGLDRVGDTIRMQECDATRSGADVNMAAVGGGGGGFAAVCSMHHVCLLCTVCRAIFAHAASRPCNAGSMRARCDALLADTGGELWLMR